jgi:hypothetical protein
MTAIAKARAKAILDMIILLVLGRNWPAYEVVIAWGRRIGGLAVIGADLRQSARPGDAAIRYHEVCAQRSRSSQSPLIQLPSDPDPSLAMIAASPPQSRQ